MNKLKIIFLAISGWILPQMVNGQVSNPNNIWGPTWYLGWDGSSNERPLHIAVDGMTRQHFNGLREWNTWGYTDFIPGTLSWYQANYATHNMGAVASSNNPRFYIGIGENNGNNLFFPRTRLHVQGSTSSFGPGTGYRPWMQTGTYYNEFSNHMYVGMYKRADETPSDGMINWGDDPNLGVGSTPNRLRINFTPTLGQLDAGIASPIWTRDREVASFWPTRQIQPGLVNALNTDNMGLGDFVNFNTAGPQSHLHMNNSFGNAEFLQITNGGDLTTANFPTGATAIDGIRFGLKDAILNGALSGTGLLYHQENRAMLFSTGNATNNVILDAQVTRERVRIMQLNTATHLPNGTVGIYDPGGLPSTNTRMSISLNPSMPLTRPLSLLHLGYNTTTNEAGWRPWMEQGILNVRNPTSGINDHVYIGFKPEPTSGERNDAVIGWGNDLTTSTNPADNLRFIFSTVTTGTGNGADKTEGQEIARFTPDCPTCPVTRGSFGIGDFSPSGGMGPGTAGYVGATLDVNGDARIRVVTKRDTLDQVLVIDPTDSNRIHWRTLPTLGTLGNTCGISPVTNPLTSSWEIPMATYNFRFADPAAPLADDQNFVGIGSTCTPRAKLEVLRNQTTNTKPLVVGAYIENSDIAMSLAFSQNAHGTYSVVNGKNKENYGVVGDAAKGGSNIGVLGNSVDPYAGTGSSVANYGVQGLAREGQQNTGLYGIASTTTAPTQNNHGAFISASASNNGTLSTNYGILTVAANNNGTTTTDNVGILSYADNLGTTTNNIGVAGISTNSGAFTPFDIGVYGEGSTAAYFTGPTTIGGAITFFSDRKIKDNVKTIDNGLDLLNKLNPVTYSYKSAQFPHLHLADGLQYGFIAQEVEAIIPELVSQVNKPEFKDKNGNVISKEEELKGLNYVGLIPVLVKGMQEQQKQIDELKALLANSINHNSNEQGTQNTMDVELSNKNIIVLDQNVPNPFAEQTTITYNLTEGVQKAQMLFYDANGRLINSVELSTASGKGQLNVFANDLSTGAYTYTLVVDGKIIDTKKMIKN